MNIKTDMREAMREHCFHGRELPAVLHRFIDLWEGQERFFTTYCGLSALMGHMGTIWKDYGDHNIKSPELEAHIRAHQKVFERLGFFAVTDYGEFLAFDLATEHYDNPPVVKLDTEGEFSYIGVDLEDALYALAEEVGNGDEAATWFARHSTTYMEIGEVGASVQFLPSLQHVYEEYYWQFRGMPCGKPEPSTAPIDERDPRTWLLHKGGEVRDMLIRKFGQRALLKQWVCCNQDGLVVVVYLRKLDGAWPFGVAGIRNDSPIEEIAERLGPPSGGGAAWSYYDRDEVRVHFTFKQDRIRRITLLSLAQRVH